MTLGRMGALADLRDAQADWLAAKRISLDSISPTISAAMTSGTQPSDGTTIVKASNPAVAYPAPGAARVDVLSYTVPVGFALLINYLFIGHIGGGQIDFTGNVVWRVLVNGGAVKGLDNLITQMGSSSQPIPIIIKALENDVVEITVEVPNGQPPMPAGTTTAAKFQGWQYPIARK